MNHRHVLSCSFKIWAQLKVTEVSNCQDLVLCISEKTVGTQLLRNGTQCLGFWPFAVKTLWNFVPRLL